MNRIFDAMNATLAAKPRAKRNRITETYNILTAAEGGPGHDGARVAAIRAGVDSVLLSKSVLAGHVAATVVGTPKAHAKFCKEIF